jgi:hypothetical protein
MYAIGHLNLSNRVTQAYITVFYQAAGAVTKRRGGIVQDEESRGITGGGIAR